MTFREIHLESWPRKDHFAFFSGFDEPFFGITVKVDCTRAYHKSKERATSFFGSYLHMALKAANDVENFRFRIKNGRVLLYDSIHASPTILRDDKTFGFGLVEFDPASDIFEQRLVLETERVKSSPGLFTREYPDNILHISAMPWLDFTSLSHARHYGVGDSCPKISFGQLSQTPEGSFTMPVSIHVHHGLADGFHVSEFLERFRMYLASD